VGLTVALAVIAALGVASLYGARQRYESTLQNSSALAIAAANLQTAAIAEQEVRRDVHGPGAGLALPAGRRRLPHGGRRGRQARAPGSAEQATCCRRRSPPAQRCSPVHRRRRSRHGSAPARPALAAVRARTRARPSCWSRLRGRLALIGALVLISLLVRSMRRPLDELVEATRALAAGELGRRVTPSGPRELRELGTAFNAMGDDLLAAERQIDEQHRRLEITIESLGDALIVTERGSPVIAAVNPSAARLVPELAVGGPVDAAESPLPPLDAALTGEAIVEHDGPNAGRDGSETRRRVPRGSCGPSATPPSAPASSARRASSSPLPLTNCAAHSPRSRDSSSFFIARPRACPPASASSSTSF